MISHVINEFGNPNVFQTQETPTPSVKPGYVLIEVKASSINPLDLKIRSGAYGHIAPSFPAILHGDVAGIITEIGEGVKDFKIGDEVFGCAGGVKGENGALSQYMLDDADLIAKKPVSLTMVQAATLPLVSITAWEALVDKVKIKRGVYFPKGHGDEQNDQFVIRKALAALLTKRTSLAVQVVDAEK